MPRFQFQILTGSSKEQCQSMYDTIRAGQNFDLNTFYLFNNGSKAYFNDSVLFDSSSSAGDDDRFVIISSNATASTDFSAGQLLFITANCTLTDAQSTPETYSAKKGEVWLVGSTADLIPENLTLNGVKEVIAKMITNGDIIDETAAGTNGFDATSSSNTDKLITAGAVQTLIDAGLSEAAVFTAGFFNKAKLVTLDSNNTDTSNTPYVLTVDTGEKDGNTPITTEITLPNGSALGDIGLVFQLQYGNDYDESGSDNDHWDWVPLSGIITKSTETASSFATKVNDAADDLADGKTYDPTDVSGDNLSTSKLITEAQLANVLANVLKDYVRYDSQAYTAPSGT